MWGACHLCGRSDTPPPRAVQHRPPPRRGGDPYLNLARRVLDLPEAESVMQTPPAPLRYSLRAQVATPLDF